MRLNSPSNASTQLCVPILSVNCQQMTEVFLTFQCFCFSENTLKEYIEGFPFFVINTKSRESCEAKKS